jgi:hypothetical protein
MFVVVHVAAAYQVYINPVFTMCEASLARRTRIGTVNPIIQTLLRMALVVGVTVVGLLIPFFGSLMVSAALLQDGTRTLFKSQHSPKLPCRCLCSFVVRLYYSGSTPLHLHCILYWLHRLVADWWKACMPAGALSAPRQCTCYLPEYNANHAANLPAAPVLPFRHTRVKMSS